MITPAQCRAARALLNLSQRQVAEASGISLRSLQGFERSEHGLRGSAMAAVEGIFSRAGVDFITEPDWVGAKLIASRQPK